jgi:lytic cellulose monooxygenase (C1-hydroxylating)
MSLLPTSIQRKTYSTSRASVPNASNANPVGLKWFKISEDGMDANYQWGVDRILTQNGWQYFTIPTCVPAGQYLMRAEIIGGILEL